MLHVSEGFSLIADQMGFKREIQMLIPDAG